MRGSLLRALAAAGALIAIAAIVTYALGGFQQVGTIKDSAQQLRHIDPRFLAAAVVLDVISLLINGAFWTRLLRAMRHPVPAHVGLAAYLSAGLAEYLANAAGAMVGTAVILRGRGIRPGRIVLIVLLADVLGLCGILVWTPLSVLLFVRGDIRIPLPVIGGRGVVAMIALVFGLSVGMLVALRALALAPSARNALARRLLGRTRVGGQPVPMPGLLRLIPLSALSWLCAALTFFVMLIGLHPAVAHKPITVIGVLALATTLGNLAFFVPAGIGVRDGLYITLLVGVAGVPMAAAALCVVAMRALDPVAKVGLLLALGIRFGLHTRSRAAPAGAATIGAGDAHDRTPAQIGAQEDEREDGARSRAVA